MTGGHIQGDILAPEDVISLLIDDAQMVQKLKEIPAQVKDRQKRKGGTKAIRIDAEGYARSEDLINPADVFTPSPAEKPASSKKRKATGEKGTPKPRSQKAPKKVDSLASNTIVSGSESDDRLPHTDNML